MDKTRFGDLPEKYSQKDSAAIVIVPVPYDGTSTYGKGSDKGPGAIISASGYVELYDIETGTEAYLRGIHTDEPVIEDTSPESMVIAVEKRISQWLEQGKFPVIIGGEHSITPGAVTAVAKKYNGLCVLQLDAHSDLREQYHGSKNNHACAMARVKDVCDLVQVGIRSMDVSEKKNMDPKKVFFAKDIHDNDQWMDKAIGMLSGTVYITIDLDVFDPSEMPSTGTPEPGGLHWYQVLKFLVKVMQKKNVVGFDIVELCPDVKNRAPDFLAAKLIYTLLSYKFKNS